MREWLARLIDRFRRDRLDEELAEELRFHRAQLERDARASGVSAEDADSAAQRRLGNVTRVREAARDRWSVPWLDHLQQDLRYAARSLRRRPGFSVAVILTLGLGIGANAAIFSAVDRLLFRAPPLLAAAGWTNQIYLSYPTPNGAGDFVLDVMPYARYLELSQGTTSFARTAAVTAGSLPLGREADASEVSVAGVSPGFFGFFDAPPALGRYFTEQDDRPPTGTPVAVLSWAAWQARYAGRTDVLGTSVRLGSTVYTVVGVAAPGFVGMWPERPPVVFLPFSALMAHGETGSGEPWWTTYDSHDVRMLAQRRHSVSVAAASADVTAALVRAWDAGGPGGGPPQLRPHAIVASVLEERGPNRTSAASVAALVAGMALIVLLIASANVANLQLGRALQRRREIAVRLALGLSRRRLLSHLLTDSVLLAVLGGVAGLAIAQWGGAALRAAILPPDTVAVRVSTDIRTLAFVGIAALVAGVLTGLAPAWQAHRVEVTRDLKLGGRQGAMNRSRTRVVLLVVQGALSVLLLVGAGLFVRSLRNVRQLRLGYDVTPLLNATFEMRGVKIDSVSRVAFRDRMVAAAQRIPGVEHAAVHGGIPLLFMRTNEGALRVPGLTAEALQHLPRIGHDLVTPDYFATMGTRIARGRGFDDRDADGAPRVMVVSRSLATLLWPGRDALGQCVHEGPRSPCATVVGIAEDTRQIAIDDPSTLFYYVPAAQSRARTEVLTLRLRGEAAKQTEAVRQMLQAEMPAGTSVSVQPFTSVLHDRMRLWRVGTLMFSIFGGLALALAAVGLYGVVSYDVAQRTREIGVRRALGAQMGDLVGLVIRQGVLLGGAGIVAGGLVAYSASKLLAPLLFEVSPRDPIVYLFVSGAMLVVTVAASVVPARRASWVDPNVALREE